VLQSISPNSSSDGRDGPPLELRGLRASLDRQIDALRAEIDALRRVTAADSSYIRFASKADVNSRHS
jgi:hypothetical protein